MSKLFANSKDLAVSDLGLDCLPITLCGVSRLKWFILIEVLYLFYHLVLYVYFGSVNKLA